MPNLYKFGDRVQYGTSTGTVAKDQRFPANMVLVELDEDEDENGDPVQVEVESRFLIRRARGEYGHA